MGIKVGDVLGWLAAGMARDEVRRDFSEITDEDITAALAIAADFTSSSWKPSA